MKKKNIFNYLLRHKKAVLLLLALALLSSAFIINYFSHNSVLVSNESYYHLTAGIQEAVNDPLILLAEYLPEGLLPALPLIFAVGVILCFLHLTKSAKQELIFFYLLIL